MTGYPKSVWEGSAQSRVGTPGDKIEQGRDSRHEVRRIGNHEKGAVLSQGPRSQRTIIKKYFDISVVTHRRHKTDLGSVMSTGDGSVDFLGMSEKPPAGFTVEAVRRL